jgi:hypothetical protein
VNANGGNMASQPIDVGHTFGAGGKLQVQAVSGNGASSGSEDDSEDDDNSPTMDMAGVGLHLNWPDVSLFANYTNYNNASNQWLWGGSLEIYISILDFSHSLAFRPDVLCMACVDLAGAYRL